MPVSHRSSDDRLARWRREIELPRGTVFLNHASFGPVPRSGRIAVERLLLRQGRFRDDPNVDDETFALLAESRRMFAAVTGSDARLVAFAPNASFGLNAILHGLDLQAGERILVPDNEFPALVYAVRAISERLGLRMVPLACPRGRIDEDHLRRELKSGTAVLAISWVQFFNGFRNNLAEISRLCHDNGCFLLADVTQGAGVVPLNARRDRIDAIACGTQKWLLGQTGGGFFAIAPDPVRKVRPPFAGWLGYDWGYTWGDLQRWDRPAFRDGRFWEVGTYPFYSVRLVHAGLTILTGCGVNNIFIHVQRLHQRLAEGLRGTDYRPIIFPDRRNRSAIVSFTGRHTARLHRYLLERRIYVSLREGNIRVSPHFYNTEADIDRLSEAVIRFGRTMSRK